MNFSFYRSRSREGPEYNPLNKDDYTSSSPFSDEAEEEKTMKQEQEQEGELEPHRKPRGCIHRSISAQMAILTSITIAVLMTAILASIGHAIIARYTKPAPLTCGTSVEEAQANGCVFDLLDYSWVPSACHDYETAEEFATWLAMPDLHHGAFPFFEDQHLKKRVVDAEALSKRVDIPTFAPQQEHEAHCIFAARRYFRTLERPELRRVKKSFMHNLHCLKELEESLTTDSTRWTSEFSVAFATC